jgi:F-type H+-transporting ATPase subunit a
MNKLTQALMEELTVEYVKVGSLQIPESVVISWVIMLLLVVGSILLTRNLKVDHISKRQAALEALYSLGKNFFEGLLGKEGSRYVPYLMTVALYIACSNVIGVFGVKPPTKDLDVTAALALMSIVLIEYAGVRARGGAGFLKSLAAPTHDPYEHPRDRHSPHQSVYATVRQRAGRVRYYGTAQAGGAGVRPGGVQLVF